MRIHTIITIARQYGSPSMIKYFLHSPKSSGKRRKKGLALLWGAVPIMSYVKIRIACMFMSMQIILHAWTVSLNSMGSIPPKPLTRL